MARRVAAVVTGQIQKSALYAAGFRHPGHTEYLASLAGLKTAPVLMLACPERRVVPATVHLQLREAVDRLRRTEERSVGKECVRTGRSRVWADPEKKNELRQW